MSYTLIVSYNLFLFRFWYNSIQEKIIPAVVHNVTEQMTIIITVGLVIVGLATVSIECVIVGFVTVSIECVIVGFVTVSIGCVVHVIVGSAVVKHLCFVTSSMMKYDDFLSFNQLHPVQA